LFVPIGDTPNPRNFTPWVNWALIAANVAIYFFISFPLSGQAADPNDPLLRDYLEVIRRQLPPGVGLRDVLAQLSAYDLFIFDHGYKPAAPSFTDLMSSMFLHANFMHLAGNMLFLWIYGDNCEHRLGRILYLVVYLLTGAAATLTFALFASESLTPLVGASGAISGVLGLYFLLFPRNQVKVFILLFPIFFNVILLPARWVLGFYVIIDNLLPFLGGITTGVAYGAHLGGFFAGLGVAWIGDRLGWKLGSKEPYSSRPTEPATPQLDLSDLERAISSGDRDTALRAFSQQGGRLASSLTPYACGLLAEWLVEAGAPISANDLLRRCLAQHRGARGPGVARIHLAMGLLQLSMDQPTAAYQHLLAVFDLEPDDETASRARMALNAIDIYRRK
jgi:membrane associated rhomboid family serine protease